MLRQTLIAAIAALALPTMAKADPLPIEFLPPDVAPRDLCNIKADPALLCYTARQRRLGP